MAKRKSPHDSDAVQPQQRRSARLASGTPAPRDTQVVPAATAPPAAASSSPPSSPPALASVPESAPVASAAANASGGRYWLLKAEPETRWENGVDVRFSIDDLAARKEPEPWDGIRSYQARNKLRQMRAGDLAFFYHSNCKDPGIVGIMRIVREATPDPSQFDSRAPYYDPKSPRDNPKWDLVHVEFVRKFPALISLRELKALGAKPGSPVQHLELLRLARLSVSEVKSDEWQFLLGMANQKGKELEATS